jgi:hypothetical protein
VSTELDTDGPRVVAHVDMEAIFVRFDAGEETAAISLDREVFENGVAHEHRQSRARGAAWSS